MSQPLLKLDTITIAGMPQQMGRSYGEQLGEQIAAFVKHRLGATRKYLADRAYPGEPDILDSARACLAILESWDPDGQAEHCATAEAADVDPAALYAAANYSDIRDLILLTHPQFASAAAHDEGCTAFALPESRTVGGRIIAGQTWDLHPDDMQYVVAVNRKPDGAPATWAITCVGCPTLIGINEHGVYVGTTNIKITGAQPGVGYLSLLHHALGHGDRRAAAGAISDAPRMAAHTYWCADAGGAIELECSADQCVQRELGDEQPMWRTNHCIDAAFRAAEAEQPSDSSFRRFKRAEAMLGEQQHDVDSIRSIFSDRSDGVLSINRYPEDQQYAATNACAIAEPASCSMWACCGPADRGEWIRLGFD